MRYLPTAVVLALAAIGFAGCAKQPAAEKPAVDAAATRTEDEKALYALGAAVSRNITSFNLTEAELKHVQAGFADGALNKKIDIDPQEYFPKIQELQTKRVAASAEIEKKAGEAFIAKASAETGARTTPTGLVYSAVTEGTGPTPASTDMVKVHYHGTLPDGKVFDSSVERKEPATFRLNEVIPCWTEGVQLMKVGGKAKLVCPSSIAYGDRGAPPDIKPGATLVFEVELLGIEK